MWIGISKKKLHRGFPGSPVVKTSPSNAGSAGQGVKMPYASWTDNQNLKQKQYCNKSNAGSKKKKKNYKEEEKGIIK